MTLRLIIDNREKKEYQDTVIDFLKTKDYICKIEPLHVGDFAIADEEGTILAILERKQCKDFASSLSDGRYREQKTRLLNTDVKWKGYILEGKFPSQGIRVGRRTISREAYYSSIIGMSCRDNLKVFTTDDVSHTARLLAQLVKKLPDYLGKTSDDTYNESLIKSVSTVRKENMTPEVCYLAQLCQIPGISHRIAKCISEKYPKMSSLISAAHSELSETSLGKRRLGKVMAKRIKEYII